MSFSLKLRIFFFTSVLFSITLILAVVLFKTAYRLEFLGKDFSVAEQVVFNNFGVTINTVLLFTLIVGMITLYIISTIIAKRVNILITDIESKFKGFLSTSKSDDIIYKGAVKEFNELIRSINNTSEIVANRNAVRAEIVSDYAHEFRTPLSLLLSNLEAISDGVFMPTKEVIDSCKVEVIRLNDMSEYLYKLADVESFKVILDKRRINISKALSSVIPLFNEYAKLKNIKLDFKFGNYTFEADRSRFQSIAINLITNAIKYSHQNSIVKIRLSKVSDDRLQLTVTDSGVGIKRADISHIFDFGYRAKHKKDKRIYGKGIGLSIVKTFVSAHGWDISVDSKADIGTTFTVTMIEKRG